MQQPAPRRRNAEPARLGTHGSRGSPEPQTDRLRMNAGHPPGNEPHRVEHRPAAPTRLAQRPIMRRAQPEPDQGVIENNPRQTEIEADRLDALARRHHAGEDAIEGKDRRRDQRPQHGSPGNRGLLRLRRSRKACRHPPLRLDRRKQQIRSEPVLSRAKSTTCASGARADRAARNHSYLSPSFRDRLVTLSRSCSVLGRSSTKRSAGNCRISIASAVIDASSSARRFASRSSRRAPLDLPFVQQAGHF